ncbi:hypothetical protein BD413DRAFT_215476 [Trametes elegans]|nr:hypothetical protein BD413DRAFT_215476 [Trametes elegans]
MSESKSFASLVDTRLKPTTPVVSGRYSNKPSSKPRNVVIPPGLFSYAGETEPLYLPPNWSIHVQPEGQRYFACETIPRVLTDVDMYSAAKQEKVIRYAGVVRKVIEDKQIKFPDSAEVFLAPSEEEDVCHYYIADHASHTLSWLEAVDLDQLYIPDVVSESQLRFSLADLYWQHIEQFPSHRLDRLSLAVEDLISIFVHGEGDHMTSSNSTFPYTAKECKNFVRVLDAAKQRLDQPPSVCVVARLWSVVSRNRLQTHYAQETARLSRDQLILALPEVRRSRVFSASSRLLLGIPQSYSEKLQSLFSDEIVYVHPWRDFMSHTREEWQQYVTWSLGLAIINVLMLPLSSVSSTIAFASLACCAVTLIASLALLLKFNHAHTWCADQAATFLLAAKEVSPAFRHTALAFSVPRAAFLWAAGFAALQAPFWLQRVANVFVLAALVGVVVLASLPWVRWARKAARALPRWRHEHDSEPEGIFKV